MVSLIKRLRIKLVMAKNSRNRKGETKRGKSQRWGNAPSPYSKYGKRPHVYSTAHQVWQAAAKSGRFSSSKPNESAKPKREYHSNVYLEAAE